MVGTAWVLGVCCAVTLGNDAVKTGSIRGVVSYHDGAAAAGLRVCVTETNQCVTSGESGQFSGLDTRPGTKRLEVHLESGEVLLAGEVETRAGLTTEVRLELPELPEVQSSVTVSASVLTTPDELVTSGVLVQKHEIVKTAGALQDVSRYVSTLPGVVTGSLDFRNDVIVRGGSPLENLFIVDNIEVPSINSFANLASAGGTVNLLDVQLIDDVTFLTGGYPATYVNRLSSVMKIDQREGSRERFRTRATFAYAGAGGIVEGPWAGGEGSWLISARRSFLDLFTDDMGFGGVPVYYSITAKAVRDFGVRDRVWATSITGLDKIRLGLTEDSKPSDGVSALDIRYSGFRNASGLNWQHDLGAKGGSLLGFAHSRATVDSTVKDLIRRGLFGPDADINQVIADGVVTFRQDSTEDETTIKYDLNLHAGSRGQFRIGGTHKHFVNNYTTLSPLGYDGPFTLVPDINPITLRERLTAMQTGAYVQATQTLAGKLRLTLGGRFDRYGHYDTAQSRFSPRAGITVFLSRKLSWNTSWGIYHQLPMYLFLAAFPENRRLVPARSEHWVSGFSWTPDAGVRVTLEGYAKRYSDYPVSTQFPEFSFANVGDTFDVRDILYPMTSAGRGLAHGVELFAEKKFSGSWFGQLNVAYSRARHAGLDGELQSGAFDRPFVFNAVAGRRISAKLELAMRMSYLTGRPYTPFQQELSEAQRRGIFDRARVNALRYPAFFTLDIRLDRTYRIGDQVIVVYGGLQNVTNRRNSTGITWNRRINRARFIRARGWFPLFGMEWVF